MNQPEFRQTSTTAIISLVSGLLGWTLLPFIGAIVAVVTGHVARAEIRRDPQLHGDGLAVAGLILGYAMIAISMIALMMALLLFGGLAALLALAHWS